MPVRATTRRARGASAERWGPLPNMAASPVLLSPTAEGRRSRAVRKKQSARSLSTGKQMRALQAQRRG